MAEIPAILTHLRERVGRTRQLIEQHRALTAPMPPGATPVMGHLREFRADILGYLTRNHAALGGVVRHRMLSTIVHTVSHPDHARHILQERHRNYNKQTRGFRTLRQFLGEGLLTNEGDAWLKQRRTIQPVFHRRHTDALASVMTRAAEAMSERWALRIARAEPHVEMTREMMAVTLQVVTEALLGDDSSHDSERIGDAMDLLLPELRFRIHHPIQAALMGPARKNRFKNAAATVDDTVRGFISAARARENPDRDDLLTVLMNARDSETGDAMSDQQLRDEVLTIFVAGHETTANALAWTWLLLSRHPDAQRRLHDELDRTLDGRVPNIDDLKALPWTRQVILEAMRLYPPAWGMSRCLIEDDSIGGHTIPAGSVVFVLPYVTHRHPDFWPNPEGFDPERFAPEQVKNRHRFAYFPFGGGPRQCIGNHFALVEAQLILATLASRFRADLIPGQDIRPTPAITLRPSPGIQMVLAER